MSAKIISILLAVVIATASLESARHIESQYVPISNRYPGIDLTIPNSSITIELIYDATCGDCTVFDKVWQQVVSSLAQSQPGKVSYKYALQVLPHRIFSFKVTQAIRYVNDKQGPEEALKLLRYFVENVKLWSEEAINDNPFSTVLDSLAQTVASLTGLPESDLRTQIAHFSDYDYLTRKWAKYAMGTLHASFTPLVFVNGARLDGAFKMTAQQLLAVITPLI